MLARQHGGDGTPVHACRRAGNLWVSGGIGTGKLQRKAYCALLGKYLRFTLSELAFFSLISMAALPVDNLQGAEPDSSNPPGE